MAFIAQMKTKKESREEKKGVHNKKESGKGTSGVHSVDENQKGEQGREKRRS